MFGSSTLEVAIGIIFVYLLLSLLATAIIEVIAAVTRLRAVFLKRGLQEMLFDPEFQGLARDVYRHPLVESLQSSDRCDLSYLPARVFALALSDVLKTHSLQRSTAALAVCDELDRLALTIQAADATATRQAEIQKLVTAARAEIKKTPIEAGMILRRLLGEIDRLPKPPAATSDGGVRAYATGQCAEFKLLKELAEAAIEEEPDRERKGEFVQELKQLCPATGSGTLDPQAAQTVLRNIRRRWKPKDRSRTAWHAAWREVGLLQVNQAFGALSAAAEAETVPVHQRLETWYDDAMQRVTGWYKRRTQVLLWAIGGVAVVLLNADTFWMANYLSRDATARAAIVATAERRARNPAPAPAPALRPGASDGEAGTATLAGAAGAMAELQQLHLPLGWFPPRLTPIMQQYRQALAERDETRQAYLALQVESDRAQAELETAKERFENAKANVTARRAELAKAKEANPATLQSSLDSAVTEFQNAWTERARLARELAPTEHRLAQLKLAAEAASTRMASVEAALHAAQAQQTEVRHPRLPTAALRGNEGVWWAWLVDWLEKLAGLFVTAAALSLGAPFWFDVLKQVMNVRTTGSRPETAAAERQAATAERQAAAAKG